MRKKAIFTAAVIIVVLTAGVIISRGKMPYKDLKASDIVSVAVYLSPPDETVQITNAEELVSYLRKVTIYNEDTSYTDYCGQTVMFTLTMADGRRKKLQHSIHLSSSTVSDIRQSTNRVNSLACYANKIAEHRIKNDKGQRTKRGTF